MAPQGGMPPSMMSQSPPYRPTAWSLGGAPKKDVDVPTTAVFLVLFIIGAAIHMTIFQRNRRRKHKFLFNGLIFGFCMARIATCILRIASVCLPHNIRLAIAAQIFVAAGVLLIFVINLIWSQRLVRSLHPKFGWHRGPSIFLRSLYVLIVFTLIILITATVQSFYTLRQRTKTIDRDLQLYGSTVFAIISFLPIPIITVSLILAVPGTHDRFGNGRLRTKIATLLAGATLLCLGASYRCGTSWLTPVPMSKPLPPYFHKAAFYILNFGVEIITLYLYAAMRVDLRFHIPDGARGPGSYNVQGSTAAASDEEKANMEKQPERGDSLQSMEKVGKVVSDDHDWTASLGDDTKSKETKK